MVCQMRAFGNRVQPCLSIWPIGSIGVAILQHCTGRRRSSGVAAVPHGRRIYRPRVYLVLTMQSLERCYTTQDGLMPKILIADDDQLLRELLEFRLMQRNFETVCASDGREALEQLEESRPDGVVLDMMMPVHDGLEVLRRMRASEAHASTPVVVLTARRGEKDIVGALELGANDYLVKPFMPEELLARLTRLLKAA